MCVQMNSRGFLKRRKHDTKKASAPPPSTSTASRYEEEEAQVHGYSWEDLQRLWPHEGSSGTCLIRHLTMPTPPNPILPHLSLSLSPHSPDNTEFIAFHTHPAAWSQGHLRQGRNYPADSRMSLRETAASHEMNLWKALLKKCVSCVSLSEARLEFFKKEDGKFKRERKD